MVVIMVVTDNHSTCYVMTDYLSEKFLRVEFKFYYNLNWFICD
jgi:hypothetical protein